jgi:hypothetical protein
VPTWSESSRTLRQQHRSCGRACRRSAQVAVRPQRAQHTARAHTAQQTRWWRSGARPQVPPAPPRPGRPAHALGHRRSSPTHSNTVAGPVLVVASCPLWRASWPVCPAGWWDWSAGWTRATRPHPHPHLAAAHARRQARALGRSRAVAAVAAAALTMPGAQAAVRPAAGQSLRCPCAWVLAALHQVVAAGWAVHSAALYPVEQTALVHARGALRLHFLPREGPAHAWLLCEPPPPLRRRQLLLLLQAVVGLHCPLQGTHLHTSTLTCHASKTDRLLVH